MPALEGELSRVPPQREGRREQRSMRASVDRPRPWDAKMLEQIEAKKNHGNLRVDNNAQLRALIFGDAFRPTTISK